MRLPVGSSFLGQYVKSPYSKCGRVKPVGDEKVPLLNQETDKPAQLEAQVTPMDRRSRERLRGCLRSATN